MKKYFYLWFILCSCSAPPKSFKFLYDFEPKLVYHDVFENSSYESVKEKYSSLNPLELKAKKEALISELSYFKLGFYLQKVRTSKRQYSLTSRTSRDLRVTMEYAPNDLEFKREWRKAVERFKLYENENSPEIKKHREENYKTRHKTKAERDSYYRKYYDLREDLKYKNLDEFNRLHDNLIDALNKMWLNRGEYLLEHFKKKNEPIPLDWLDYRDLQGIEKEDVYIDLTRQIDYLTHLDRSKKPLIDTDQPKLIRKEVKFEFKPSGFQLETTGQGYVDVYSNKLEIQIEEGTIRINPIYKRFKTSFAYALTIGISRYTSGARSFDYIAGSKKTIINKKFKSREDFYDISDLKFTVKNITKEDLKNSRITLTIYMDNSFRSTNYSHSSEENENSTLFDFME